MRGKPGAVVVIFDDEPLVPEDDDEAEPKFSWHMTWQGEHEDEGDMALYASDPFAQLVGPGIGRALYGGFPLNRHRPPDVRGVGRPALRWRHRHQAAEVLLRAFAALDYFRAERLLSRLRGGHAAALGVGPARAARMDKKIVYVPLG